MSSKRENLYEKHNREKCIAILLVCMMLLPMLPANLLAHADETAYPVMEAYNSASSADYHKYYNKV